MDFSYFVGKKIATSSEKSFTRLIIRLAVAGVALSIAVMLLAVGVVKGFQNQIRNKVIGFDGHIHIRNLDLNQSRELKLIDFDPQIINALTKNPEIETVSPFCIKAGIINTDKEIEGMVFKGVPANYNWSFIKQNLTKGRLPNLSDSADTYEFLLSKSVSDKIGVDTGQNLEIYFIHNGKVRRRKMVLTGIFNTGLGEFDKTICFTDLRVIQRIYTTDYSKVSGYEVWIKNLDSLSPMTDWVDENIPMNMRAQDIESQHQIIFQWLHIVDSNAIIIIVLMGIVSMVNLITAFLILIIDRTQMIGILKALGAQNRQVLRIFLLKGILMILPGMIIGNVLGLGIAFLQTHFGILTLPEETYYMSVVPVMISWKHFVLINLGSLTISILIMFLPGVLVKFISPVKAIRFD